MKAKRVALYARVSTNDQTTENQLEDLRRYAEERGWAVHEEYVDHAISGSKSSRPALDRMMSAARKKRFSVVLVWRFDRFARSVKHLVLALEELRGLSIGFVSYQENVDTNSPLGAAIFTIIAAMAQLERDIIIERVHAGLRRAKAQGKKVGRPPMGQADAGEMDRLHRSGVRQHEIARRLGVSRAYVSRSLASLHKTHPKSNP